MEKRKNESQVDIDLFNYLTNLKKYSVSWKTKKTQDKYIQQVLDTSSKRLTGERGEPDLIYVNDGKRLLILIENKDSIKDHEGGDGNNPAKYAVDGIKHYLSCFLNENLEKISPSIKSHFEDWSIVGIAFSGNVNDEYNHLISTFVISNNEVKDIGTSELLDEDDYLAFFENIDIETISKNISVSSSEINTMLRALDSQKRPVLLSALMICLYDRDNVSNDFKKGYSNWSSETIIGNIPITVKKILSAEGIDNEKIDVLINELSFIRTDNDLNSTNILKEILSELEKNVIPLFNKKTNYDIIGRFYEEFLRYAGVANVKKGIVLTPSHVTKLFSELIDIKTNDVIFDTCCGTGAFLISAMNNLISGIGDSNISNKNEKIKKLKENQLVGFEKSTTMYSLAISNMLFRGDGKSRIYNVDTFSKEATKILSNLKRDGIHPSIGFINPPYGGLDNKKNPTKKELQFLEHLLDNVSRYGVIIAPLSTYFKDNVVRNRILSKHTLKLVINMPAELFQPNASTHTAIAVFETNTPHNDKEVVFYDLKDDGFVLSKSRGRTDVLNKWNGIKKSLLLEIKNVSEYQDEIHLLETKITKNDEWIIQSHSKTDYSKLREDDFVKSIKTEILFSLRKKFNLLERELDPISLVEILGDSINIQPLEDTHLNFNDIQWGEFDFNKVFKNKRGTRHIKLNQIQGNVPYISSTKENNGIDNYITPPEDMIVYENAMTINNSGSVGYAFYHNYSFVNSDHCTVFWIKDKSIDLNVYIGVFLRPIVEAFGKSKYNFGREISDERLAKENIRLPIDDKGRPDWEFMERYIKSLPYSSSIKNAT